MAVLGSLFVFLLCSHLMNAGRVARMTSGDDGQWVDDTNTRLVMGEDEQSQATGWNGNNDDGKWVDDTNTRLVMGEDAQSQATGWAGENDEGKWIDDTNTRLVMGEDEQSQATGWTATDEAAAAVNMRRKRFSGRNKKMSKQNKDKDMTD